MAATPRRTQTAAAIAPTSNQENERRGFFRAPSGRRQCGQDGGATLARIGRRQWGQERLRIPLHLRIFRASMKAHLRDKMPTPTAYGERGSFKILLALAGSFLPMWCSGVTPLLGVVGGKQADSAR